VKEFEIESKGRSTNNAHEGIGKVSAAELWVVGMTKGPH